MMTLAPLGDAGVAEPNHLSTFMTWYFGGNFILKLSDLALACILPPLTGTFLTQFGRLASQPWRPSC